MSVLRVDHLYKVFGRHAQDVLRRLQAGEQAADVRRPGTTAAVIDATFSVEAGEIFVVMGLSGSGKSTLLRMLNGLLEATAGDVYIGDERLTGLAPKQLRTLRSRKISMVFQHFALLPHRSVLDNAGYGLSIQGVEKSERHRRAREALELVGLGEWSSSLPGELSGGMQQRVGLARALATDADILLMDEAFSALDPLIRRGMQDQLIELQRSLQKTIVFITHDLNEAMRLGDRIAVMRSGEIVQIGTAEDVLNDPANDYVQQFTQDVDRSRVLTASSVMAEPVTSIMNHEGARAAERRMRELQVSALFVIDRGRHLVGAVRDTVVADAARRGGVDRLDDVADSEITQVPPDMPVSELFAPSAESQLPLAVVDEQSRLVGVIPRVTLLAALGGIEPSSDDPHVATVPTAPEGAAPPLGAGSAARTGAGVGPAGDDVANAVGNPTLTKG